MSGEQRGCHTGVCRVVEVLIGERITAWGGFGGILEGYFVGGCCRGNRGERLQLCSPGFLSCIVAKEPTDLGGCIGCQESSFSGGCCGSVLCFVRLA